ncbi:MAG: type IV pilus secretin PilQ [bacterium]
MVSRKYRDWLATLSKITLISIVAWQTSACLSSSKNAQIKPILEIQKVPSDPNQNIALGLSDPNQDMAAGLSDPNQNIAPGDSEANESFVLDPQITEPSANPEITEPSTDPQITEPVASPAASDQVDSEDIILNRDIVRSAQPAPVKFDQIRYINQTQYTKQKDEAPSSVLKKSYNGKPISLDFQDADIRSVLRLIAEISNRNLVIDPDVKGKVNITLHKPVPWDQALEIVLKTNRLAMKMEGNIIRVGNQKTFTQEEEAALKAIQAKQMTEQAEKKTLPPVTEIVSINYSQASKLKDQLTPMLSSPEGLSEPPSMVVDERTNSLIIKDLPENIKKIKTVLAELDRETPQVMIETRIVETTKGYSKELGIRWGGAYQKQTSHRFPNTIDVTGIRGGIYAVNLPNAGDVFGGIGLNLGHINNMVQLNLELDSMESQGKGRIISNPRIATLDNETAVIRSGAQIPYPAVDKEGNPTTNFVDAVIKLGVTPHITPNNYITLEIEADKSEPNWAQTVNGVPAITTRTATTKLIVKDGDTAVIGGLYQRSQQKSQRKVPWFGSVPVLGWFFKANRNEESYDELLIFITPKIIERKG